MDDFVKITAKFKNTCSHCNRAMFKGETILWNKKTQKATHLPEMCEFLGIRKKMPKRRKTIVENVFPVEVRKI